MFLLHLLIHRDVLMSYKMKVESSINYNSNILTLNYIPINPSNYSPNNPPHRVTWPRYSRYMTGPSSSHGPHLHHCCWSLSFLICKIYMKVRYLIYINMYNKGQAGLNVSGFRFFRKSPSQISRPHKAFTSHDEVKRSIWCNLIDLLLNKKVVRS